VNQVPEAQVSRSLLNPDELVAVYIVLRTPQMEEKTLMAHLSRLELTLEVYAMSTVASKELPDARNEQGPASKELLFSQTMKATVEPIVIAVQASTEEQGEDESQSNYVYIAWKMDVSLGRSAEYHFSGSLI
jgi:hypothetical protein